MYFLANTRVLGQSLKVVDSSFPKFCHVEGALLTPGAVPRFGRGITSGLLTFPSTQLFSNDVDVPGHRPLFFSLLEKR